jgi:hypothetical protein
MNRTWQIVIMALTGILAILHQIEQLGKADEP